jgi:hypothetical protein
MQKREGTIKDIISVFVENGGVAVILHIKGYITNSLAVHYLEWHRKDVPEKETAKLKSIKPRSKGR